MKTRGKIIIANWKMNPAGRDGAVALARQIESELEECRWVEVVVAPPAPFILPVSQVLRRAKLGAQNAFWEEAGPYTGETSWSQLKDLGVDHVILGHSERRIHLAESDEMIARKVASVAGHEMKAVVCVGERNRPDADISAEVETQLRAAIAGLKRSLLKNVIVCYEPVWAISTMPGSSPDTPDNAFRAGVYIRKIVADMFGVASSDDIRVIYGGSVTADNVAGFFSDGNMEGALVGGASLRAEEFGKIARLADEKH
ncbi:MAG: triose-phosphate isomerase, partial [Candidatus Sungbacteria bacterium]|nr:triose-phosphate isomerase [Candidatus Sungbacteria bacterium]